MDRHLRRITPHVVRRQAIRRKTRHCHSHFYARCAHWSFHAETPSSKFRWAREGWVLGGGVLLLALLTLLGIPTWASVMLRHDTTRPVTRKTLALQLPPAPKETAQPVVASWKTVEVHPGETLSEIFQNQGLGASDLAEVMASGKDTGSFDNLKPGDKLGFRININGSLAGFRYYTNSATLVTLTASKNGLQSEVTELPVQRHVHFAHGVVNSSVSAAAAKAGLPYAMVLQLAKVFKHEVDFGRNLKPGDRFTVVYDDVYRNGQFVHEGNILAAEFTNAGHKYTAYRFKKPDGNAAYYSADGLPLMQALLLRAPVAYTRISSPFGMRVDPITHKYQLHTGIDYAAPIGTPIHAAGNGVITFRSRKHGFGNMIAIRNTPTYTTEYAHMSRFAKGLHVGSRVTQGEVIGYVGQTGFATGPHLHYQVMVNGKPENPLSVTMPKPQPLSGKLMAEFKAQSAPMIARIQMIDDATQRLARVDNGHGNAVAAD
jgi:murein DD-endopeptidase MepM/ murein hydrolase activator NlpD